MDELDTLLLANKDELLAALPTFQQKLVNELLAANNDPLSVANTWLTANQPNTASFGGTGNKQTLFLDMVLAELEKFLCGASNSKYKEQRKHVGTGVKVGLGAVSTSIASMLGVPGTVIMPVIVLIILSGGQITVNAWCEMRKKQRMDQESSE